MKNKEDLEKKIECYRDGKVLGLIGGIPFTLGGLCGLPYDPPNSSNSVYSSYRACKERKNIDDGRNQV